jgi:hypothetical protein
VRERQLKSCDGIDESLNRKNRPATPGRRRLLEQRLNGIAAFRFHFDSEEFVETFGQGRVLEPFERGENRWFRNSIFACARIVALERLSDVGFKEIADNAKASSFGRLDIAGAIGNSHIGIVDDEALIRFEAEFEQARFAISGFEQIETDSHVGVEEALLVEVALAASLNADENHRFHKRSTW